MIANQLVNQQYATALEAVEPLILLGAESVARIPSRDLARQLARQVQECLDVVNTPTLDGTDQERRLLLAKNYFSLAQFSQVNQQLAPLADSNPEAAIRLGLVEEVQQNWQAASDRYHDAIDMLTKARPLLGSQKRLLRIAVERRVNNLRRTGEFRLAEQELLDGLEAWPDSADSFLLQLGFHYQMAGRPADAAKRFEEAAIRNPNVQELVDREIAKLNQEAAGCFIRPRRAATR